MKLKYHEQTDTMYIQSDTSEDLYLMGQLSKVIKDARVYPTNGDNREIQCSGMDLIKQLVEKK